jgi:hypothetical protein
LTKLQFDARIRPIAIDLYMFISSEQQRRSAAFDRYVFRADSVLNRFAVAQALGVYAAPLRAVNEQVFLPNVRHGRVTLTPQQIDSNTIPLLPLTPGEDHGTFRHSSDFLWPAKSTMQALRFKDPAIADELQAKVTSSKDKDIARLNNRWAYAAHSSFGFEENQVNSRPFIITTTELERQPVDLPVGAIMLHEYTHVLQRLPLCYRPQPHYELWDKAGKELEANWVGFAAMEGVGLNLEQIWKHLPFTYETEMYRRAEVDPRNPFVATQALVDYLRPSFENS